jgi:hypothetical protein
MIPGVCSFGNPINWQRNSLQGITPAGLSKFRFFCLDIGTPKARQKELPFSNESSSDLIPAPRLIYRRPSPCWAHCFPCSTGGIANSKTIGRTLILNPFLFCFLNTAYLYTGHHRRGAHPVHCVLRPRGDVAAAAGQPEQDHRGDSLQRDLLPLPCDPPGEPLFLFIFDLKRLIILLQKRGPSWQSLYLVFICCPPPIKTPTRFRQSFPIWEDVSRAAVRRSYACFWDFGS